MNRRSRTPEFQVALYMVLVAACATDVALYDRLQSLDSLHEAFVAIRTDRGIDFNSKETVALSEGQVVPRFQIIAEGPFERQESTTLEEELTRNVATIINEVSASYAPNDPVVPGIGGTIVDVNGMKVGFLDYQPSFAPDTYARRALVVGDKGLYAFTIVMFNSTPMNRHAMYLDTVVIEAVNSGDL